MQKVVRPPVHVGMTVCLVHTLNRRVPLVEQNIIITKVGRDWATTNSRDGRQWHRFSLETWAIDGRGFSSPGMAYESFDQYLAESQLEEAWRQFRRDMHYLTDMPESMTVERINQARQLLGMQGV